MDRCCQAGIVSVALVTGPTSGIGLSFAQRLANDGYDLVLVSRDEPRLDWLATELERQGATAEVLVADLADPVQRMRVEERLADRKRPIEVLVNNAGFGVNQHFVGGQLSREQQVIDVMVTSVMRLTHAAVAGMSERGSGSVINVSSMAGFLPFGTYSAAKGWVTTFTQGLATELTGSGVSTIAVCPGFVRTEFHQRAGIDMSKSSNWMWEEPDAVVAAAMRDLKRGKVISVSGRQYQALAVASHLLPRAVVRRLERFRRRRLG
jgi:short-subunit dehydrogenase